MMITNKVEVCHLTKDLHLFYSKEFGLLFLRFVPPMQSSEKTHQTPKILGLEKFENQIFKSQQKARLN